MNIRLVLRKAKDFVTYDLKGDAGSMEPMSAKYDADKELWTITYDFYKEASEDWATATIFIDNITRVIISFEVVDKQS